MALKPYKVSMHGIETTLLLDDVDAKARGLLTEKQAPRPANMSRRAPNKSGGK